jgi:ferrochelatase
MRPTYRGVAPVGENRPAPIGVLVANLGTPDAPTPAAVRRLLAEFLADPRVVELPRPLWWLILHAFVLPFRPRRSARLYARIWQSSGSPLLTESRELVAALVPHLTAPGAGIELTLGMRYGSPSARAALRDLAEKGCDRLLVLSLFPQYSSTTVGSTFDDVSEELARWRHVPELRIIRSYHDDPAYVAALAASVRESWAAGGVPDRLVMSFHGLPQRYVDAGDPYQAECQRTAELLRAALEWPRERTLVSFQSRFGREPWIEPATDATLRQLGASGVGSVDVICPGFATDCLETLEEIAITGRETFLEAGGKAFRYVRALGSRPDHVDALAALVRRHLAGWVEPVGIAAGKVA